MMNMNNIIYKTFRTPLYCYVYDRQTNKILRVTEEDYNELNDSNLLRAETVKRFQQKGFLLESKLKEIEHPDSKLLEHHLGKRVEYLLLQVTQECNLRCSYCIYSGNYEAGRTHTDLNMSEDLAFRAIDYLVKHSGELPEIVLGFYGGEPMLRMDLIKKCVDYINALVPDRTILFSMTTNGTLLTLEHAKYLYEKGFNITISLDGAKEDHDKNRIFRHNEKGSFDTIMNNIKRIKDNIPEFLDRITFNTVLNHNCDYSCVRDYYNTNEIVKDASHIFNLVEADNLKTGSQFSEQFLLDNSYDQFTLFMYMLGKCEKEYVLKAFQKNALDYIDFYKMIKQSPTLGEKYHHNGPCVPGARRLFVSAKGKFYPCERVPEEEITEIGDIDHGLNIESAKKILNVGVLTEESCKNCWALAVCDQCVSKAVESGSLSMKAKLKHCAQSKERSLDKLKVVCMLKEFKFNFEEALP